MIKREVKKKHKKIISKKNTAPYSHTKFIEKLKKLKKIRKIKDKSSNIITSFFTSDN